VVSASGGLIQPRASWDPEKTDRQRGEGRRKDCEILSGKQVGESAGRKNLPTKTGEDEEKKRVDRVSEIKGRLGGDTHFENEKGGGVNFTKKVNHLNSLGSRFDIRGEKLNVAIP